jgi:hypothetical protein
VINAVKQLHCIKHAFLSIDFTSTVQLQLSFMPRLDIQQKTEQNGIGASTTRCSGL